MEETIKLTQSKQKIAHRRKVVKESYQLAIKNKEAITLTVNRLSKRFKVSMVTIYSDIDLIKNEDK